MKWISRIPTCTAHDAPDDDASAGVMADAAGGKGRNNEAQVSLTMPTNGGVRNHTHTVSIVLEPYIGNPCCRIDPPNISRRRLAALRTRWAVLAIRERFSPHTAAFRRNPLTARSTG
jgi:hypothetical protein